MNKQEFINKWAKRIYGLALSGDTDSALQNLRDAVEEIMYIEEIRTCYMLHDTISSVSLEIARLLSIEGLAKYLRKKEGSDK